MMEQKILITELAREIANRRNMAVADVERFINEMFVLVEEALKSESLVKIKGLGSFKLVRVEARESVNINTGQRFTIEEHTKISFTPDAALRDQINKPFAEFETVILNDDVDQEDLERIDAETQEVEADDVEETPVEEVVKETEEVIDVADETADVNDEQADSNDEPAEVLPVATEPATPVVQQHIESQHVTDMNVAQQHVEHQTIEPSMDMSPNTRSGHLNIWEVMAMMVFFIVMMALSYAAGYNRWLLGGESDNVVQQTVSEPNDVTSDTSVAEISGELQENADSIANEQPQNVNDTTAQAQARRIAEIERLAKDYPQVAGGKYLIVGLLEEHEVRRGESLRGLSIKYYGNKDFVPYILKLNEFTNPDIIPLGYKLKMPKLEQRAE